MPHHATPRRLMAQEGGAGGGSDAASGSSREWEREGVMGPGVANMKSPVQGECIRI